MWAGIRWSSLTLFVVVEKLANFSELGFRGFARGEGALHQQGGGTVEGAFQQVSGDLFLRLFSGAGRFVHVGALLFIAANEGFLGHDLHLFEDRGVLSWLALGDYGVDVADGGRAAAPEDGQDFQFGFGRARRHLRRAYYEDRRSAREKQWTGDQIAGVTWSAGGWRGLRARRPSRGCG